MRVGYKTLLFAVAVLVNADASLGHNGAAINPKFQVLPRSYNVKQNAVPTSRILGVFRAEDEERIGVPTSVVEQAKSIVTTVSTEKLAKWLNKGEIHRRRLHHPNAATQDR
uniref:Avh216 n=1 Tax=Phytophthora sojae TaxID=67593 RepID=E0W5E4_PHYSO|nr:Avh216 [Phytophthora sojae]AEK80946.1 Avh216 [Phytophthora sojae]AEK80947.1 Avh216 [Phytophthora sojae]